jgi:hypothetical protein
MWESSPRTGTPAPLAPLSAARASSGSLAVTLHFAPRRYEVGDSHGPTFGRLLDDLRGDVLAVSSEGAWRCGIGRSWRGWAASVEDQLSGRVVANYTPRWRAGGTLVCFDDRSFRLRKRLGQTWRLHDAAHELVVQIRPPKRDEKADARDEEGRVVSVLEPGPALQPLRDAVFILLVAIWTAGLETEALARGASPGSFG